MRRVERPEKITKDSTVLEMSACLEIWDQAIGCSNCGNADWTADTGNKTPDVPQSWHKEDCPLRFREDIFRIATFDMNCFTDAEVEKLKAGLSLLDKLVSNAPPEMSVVFSSALESLKEMKKILEMDS